MICLVVGSESIESDELLRSIAKSSRLLICADGGAFISKELVLPLMYL